MKIKKVFLLGVMAYLLHACSLFNDKQGYVEPEKVQLERSATDRAQTLTELGLAYYQLGKYKYASEYLDRSLKLDEKNPVTYQVMALINERSQEPELAELNFDKALTLAPEDFDILTSYAIFLYQQERYDESLIALNKVAEAPFYKKKWIALTYLGYYDLKENKQRQAEKKFYYALKANEYYAPALLAMSKIRYDKGKMMSARAYVERYFSAAGQTEESLKLAIKIESALQSYDMVEEYQLEFKRKFPFAE